MKSPPPVLSRTALNIGRQLTIRHYFNLRLIVSYLFYYNHFHIHCQNKPQFTLHIFRSGRVGIRIKNRIKGRDGNAYVKGGQKHIL